MSSVVLCFVVSLIILYIIYYCTILLYTVSEWPPSLHPSPCASLAHYMGTRTCLSGAFNKAMYGRMQTAPGSDWLRRLVFRHKSCSTIRKQVACAKNWYDNSTYCATFRCRKLHTMQIQVQWSNHRWGKKKLRLVFGKLYGLVFLVVQHKSKCLIWYACHLWHQNKLCCQGNEAFWTSKNPAHMCPHCLMKTITLAMARGALLFDRMESSCCQCFGCLWGRREEIWQIKTL